MVYIVEWPPPMQYPGYAIANMIARRRSYATRTCDIFAFVMRTHFKFLLDSNGNDYKAYLQRLLTNVGHNTLTRRKQATGRWRLTARCPSRVTAPPGRLVM